MDGMPPEIGGMGFDTSMFMLTGYLFAGLVVIILGAIGLGILTLPIYFLILYVGGATTSALASATGWFPLKVVLIMFRGLWRNLLRTSLTYLAIFVLTLV